MPDDKDLKRLIRARMAKTGESYTAARRQVLSAGRMPAEEPAFQEDLYQGSVRSITYPFDRLTKHASKAMALAQGEAERDGRGYIGSEHLLLGLFRAEGTGELILRNCGASEEAVRAAAAARFPKGAREALPAGMLAPTARVKAAIEIAFQEARRLGHPAVGSEHLLLGMLIEREGFAGQLLPALGADLERVYAEISRGEDLRAVERNRAVSKARSGQFDATRDWLRAATRLSPVIDAAVRVAHDGGAGDVTGEHLAQAVAMTPEAGDETEALAEPVIALVRLVDYILFITRWPMPRNQRAQVVERLTQDVLWSQR